MNKLSTSLSLQFIILIFITKANSQTPAWQWAKGAGLTGEDKGSSVAVDNQGNIYATGWYTSASISFGTSTLTNTGASDFFVVKYDPSGNVIWAKNLGGSGGDIGYDIATDVNGNALVTGWFSSPDLVLGSFTLTNTSAGSSDVFVVKFDPSGNVLWAKSGGSNTGDVSNSITTDASGNAYITGAFSGPSCGFSSYSLSNASSGTNDIFIVKYDPSGNAAWAVRAGGASADEGYGICTDKNGNVFVAGLYNSATANFGGTSLPNSGGSDCFIARYTAATGALSVVKSVGSGNDEAGYGITESNGKIFLTGKFTSASVNFSQVPLLNAGAGTADVFIAMFNTSLSVLWAKSAGGQEEEIGYGIDADEMGNAYATGRFVSPSILFGSTTLSNTSSGYADIWVVKYDSTGNAKWARTAVGDYEDEGRSVAVDAQQNVHVSGKFNSSSLTFDGSVIYKGCGDDFFIARMGSTTGFFETSTSESVRIYPNPNTGIFRIVAEKDVTGMEIYNSLGENVYSKGNCTFNAYGEIVDLSLLSEGVYFCRIFRKGTDLISSQKIIFIKK